jgi:hypothetical protein
MDERNNMTKTFVEKAVIDLIKPSYFWDGNVSKSKEELESLRIIQPTLYKKMQTDNKQISEIEPDKLIPQKEFIKKFTENLENRETDKQIMEEDLFQKDDINHPKHYNSDVFPQTIDMMLQLFTKDEVMAFCKLNSFKYRMRCGHKFNTDDEIISTEVYNEIIQKDIKKAMWYENMYKELNTLPSSEN